MEYSGFQSIVKHKQHFNARHASQMADLKTITVSYYFQMTFSHLLCLDHVLYNMALHWVIIPFFFPFLVAYRAWNSSTLAHVQWKSSMRHLSQVITRSQYMQPLHQGITLYLSGFHNYPPGHSEVNLVTSFYHCSSSSLSELKCFLLG